MNEVLQGVANNYGICVPSPTTHRKWIDSAAWDTCDSVEMEALNRHMSHSSATSKKWYQFQNPSMLYFTKEEDTAILKEYPLTETDTPTLHACQQIIDRHTLERTKKQV